MRAMIRLAACVVMAASSTATFAEGDEPTSPGEDQQSIKDRAGSAATNPMEATGERDDADVGAASGEPARMDARAGEDARARDNAAAQYDELLRQSEVWTSP